MDEPPLLPPQWWVDRINAARRDIGPWHIATRTPLPPLYAITGV
jgi:hypothetical protein